MKGALPPATSNKTRLRRALGPGRPSMSGLSSRRSPSPLNACPLPHPRSPAGRCARCWASTPPLGRCSATARRPPPPTRAAAPPAAGAALIGAAAALACLPCAPLQCCSCAACTPHWEMVPAARAAMACRLPPSLTPLPSLLHLCPLWCRNLRAETSIALAEMAGASGGSGGSRAANQQDALEEARLAGEAGRQTQCACGRARGICNRRTRWDCFSGGWWLARRPRCTPPNKSSPHTCSLAPFPSHPLSSIPLLPPPFLPCCSGTDCHPPVAARGAAAEGGRCDRAAGAAGAELRPALRSGGRAQQPAPAHPAARLGRRRREHGGRRQRCGSGARPGG